MPITDLLQPQILILAPLIVFAAYVVFGISGFGSTLIAVPLLAMPSLKCPFSPKPLLTARSRRAGTALPRLVLLQLGATAGIGGSTVVSAATVTWVQKRPVDWPAVLALLERAGLKTAAWMMLSWFLMLAPPHVAPILDRWIDSVRPGRLRAAYLRQWLERNLPSRWLDRPFLIQFGFTLPLHDRPGDVLHALRGLRQARGNRLSDARALMGEEFDFNQAPQ